MKIGKDIFVGESSRTNQEGIAVLKEIAQRKGYRVISVPVHGALHLKTAVTYVGKSTLVVAPQMVEVVKKYMQGFSIIELRKEHAYAANVLRVDGRVLIPSEYPTVAARLKKLGLKTQELEMSEFMKGEGGLTCLSILFSPLRK